MPTINVNQCRSYTFSVQINSDSAANVGDSSNLAHYLLYCEAGPQKVLKSMRMYARPNHTVFGLEADTLYDLVIIACNGEGECTMSDVVTLRTERDS